MALGAPLRGGASTRCGLGTMPLTLEPLSNERIAAAEEHDAAAEDEEAEVDVVPALVTDTESTKLILLGQSALRHPTVTSQALLGLDTWSCDAWCDAALSKTAPVLLRGVGLIPVDLPGSEAALP